MSQSSCVYSTQLTVIRSTVRNCLERLWLCYSSPILQSSAHLLILLAVCLSVAAVTSTLLFYWLIDLLKYGIHTVLAAVAIYATAVSLLLTIIHPFRCAFTLIFPTLFTQQGRKLLLSTSVMIVVLYILPNIAANIATLTNVVKCTSEKLSQSLLNSSQLINTIKDNLVGRAADAVDLSFVQTLHDFDHTTKINISEVKERLHFLSERVKDDFSDVKSQIQSLKLLFSRIFAAVFVLYLFSESVSYLWSYLTSVRFDNTYITAALRKKGVENRIVVELKDVKDGVNSTSFRITKKELFRCLTPALIITLYLIMTVETEPAICPIFASNCLFELINFNKTYTALIQTSPHMCEVQSSQLNPGVVVALMFLYLLSFSMLPLDVYARRLRWKVAASFFPYQEERRVEFLFKKILTKRKGNE
ncbi:hypothetical protein DNTS_021059 [Danionella cerebrum]|uniref:Dendritic cell-specific transmembrane protein-like domain-containing protein n=1 Tax=Danionella cerebrum TaxID=2873325 RepID=A0A553MWQ6_9TELE|nr:hypothetical protein DNTS_021059 [Danionella translucida]